MPAIVIGTEVEPPATDVFAYATHPASKALHNPALAYVSAGCRPERARQGPAQADSSA